MRLAIIGGSVRAACQSAVRAGVDVVLAADQFCDRDMAPSMTERFRIEPGYKNLETLVREAAPERPPTHWIYTGAMENYSHRFKLMPWPLLGNDRGRVRDLRQPLTWTAKLRAEGITTAEVRPGDARPSHDLHAWLRKPLGSAGGIGVRQLTDSDAITPGDSAARAAPDVYYQRRVMGDPLGAVFAASPNRVRLVGVTRQLIGAGACPNHPFLYAGSIGPLLLEPKVRTQWQALGSAIFNGFRPLGLFGVDAIWDGDCLVPIEINPRYTASVEVLERARYKSTQPLLALRDHIDACLSETHAFAAEKPLISWIAGKRIVYGTRTTTAGPEFQRWADTLNRKANPNWPCVTDLPHAGTQLQPGEPVCTVHVGPIDRRELAARRNDLDATAKCEAELSQLADVALQKLNWARD